MPWYLYLVRCRDGSLYAGISHDVARRLEAHRAGRGSRYLRGRGPLVLERRIRVGGRSQALRVEHKVKRMRKERKEKLARGKVRLKDIINNDLS
jgi:putative endonuclease